MTSHAMTISMLDFRVCCYGSLLVVGALKEQYKSLIMLQSLLKEGLIHVLA